MLTSNDIETQLTQRRLDSENFSNVVKQLQSQINALKLVQPSTVATTIASKQKPVSTINNLFLTQTDVSGSRAFNTAYHNSSTKPMVVSVTIIYALTAIAPTGEVFALTDSSNPPTTVIGASGLQFTGTLNGIFPITFIVLPGNYYKISVSAGTPTVNNWFEWV